VVVGSRPQVGSSVLVAPRRRLATAAFDQAVNVFLFIEHEHTNIVKSVGVGRVVLPMLVGSRAPSTLLHQRPHILDSLRPWSAPTRARGHLLL
jgi:hypothetical protein